MVRGRKRGRATRRGKKSRKEGRKSVGEKKRKEGRDGKGGRKERKQENFVLVYYKE